MTRRFADTSFFIAYLNPRDQWHAAAKEHMAHSRDAVVTTFWVLIELGNYLAGSTIRRRFVPFVRDLAREPRMRIVRPSGRFADEAFEAYDTRADKAWSVTDCLSFVVMRKQRLREALSTDHHFE